MTQSIQGRSLYLRQTQPDDAPTLWRAYHDHDFMSLYSTNFPLPESEAALRQRLAQRLQHSPETLRFVECLIVHHTDGPIGIAALSDYSVMHKRAEYTIGIFSAKHQGRYGLEATLLMMGLAFNQFRLNRLYAYSYAYNTASADMMQRVGFAHEGVLTKHHYSKQNQTYVDLHAFGMTEDSFRQNKNLARWSRRLLGFDVTQPPQRVPQNVVPLPKPTATESAPTSLEVSTSRQFLSWLHEQNLSLAVTTYKANRLFLFGLQPNGKLSVFQRTFPRCMGLTAVGSQRLYLSSLYQLWQLENSLRPNQQQNGYDALFVPQIGYTTADIDIHDIALPESAAQPIFVSTLFSCLATVDSQYSFRPVWQPPFISKLAAEDRCHLNGLAMRDGQPAYVTSVSQSDLADGWRDFRQTGGTVTDVGSNEVVLTGLSMPHSPRWSQDKLWLLNSGQGEFGYVDVAAGKFEPVTMCAGYGRGLVFHNDFAIVGLSKPRHNKTFQGLALDELLTRKQTQPRCGLQIIDLRTGDAVHWLRFDSVVEELYDVAVLPNVRRPMALGFQTDEIRRMISLPPQTVSDN